MSPNYNTLFYVWGIFCDRSLSFFISPCEVYLFPIFLFLPYSYMNYIFNITHIGNAYLIQLNSFCLWIELFDLITFNDISVPGFSFLYCVCLLYIYVSCTFLQSSFTKSILSAPLFQLMHWFLLFFSKYLISDLSKI